MDRGQSGLNHNPSILTEETGEENPLVELTYYAWVQQKQAKGDIDAKSRLQVQVKYDGRTSAK
jgi:hypothetical protein